MEIIRSCVNNNTCNNILDEGDIHKEDEQRNRKRRN